jgi:hypothetical protein
MKLYYHLYFCLFLIWSKKKNEQSSAKINAIITLTFLLYCNVLTVPLLYMHIFRASLFHIGEVTLNVKFIIAFLLIAGGIFNYFFLCKYKHLQIENLFYSKTDKIRKIAVFFTYIYLFASFLIPIYILFNATPLS